MAIASLTPRIAGAGRVVSADGTRIAFERSGDGDPIVLVDGAFCSRTFGPMATLAPLLAQDFTVFAYDRRGRGDSGDTKPYAVDREIEDLQAVIDAAGGSAHVFGMSSGAILALDAAACGLSIHKLALYEPPFVADPDRYGDQSATTSHDAGPRNRLFDGSSRHVGSGQAPPADATEQLTAMIDAGRRSDAVAYFMKLMGMPSFVLAIMRFLPLWSKLKAVAHTLPYDSAIVGEGSLPAQAASVDVPTIVIGGEKSPPRLRNAVRSVAHAMPNAQPRFLDGQDHNVAAKILAPVLEQFFRG